VLAPHPFYQERGTPIAVDLLVRALSERGDEVDLLTYHEGQPRAYPRVTHHRIRVPGWCRGVRPGFSLKKLVCDLALAAEARRLMRRARYDVIHAGEEAVFIAMRLGRVHGVPYVYDMDSSIAQQLVEKLGVLRPLSPVLDRLESRAIRRSAAVAPVCRALEDLARARGAPRIVTLHDISQIDEREFEPDPALREGLGLSGTLGMYVGNLEPYQGLDLLLESLPLARRETDVSLCVAGGAPADIERYRRKTEALGVGAHVRFIGPWPAKELGRLLATADFLVAPRIRGINTPMKIFPYLHSGRPVLVTDLPTHTQILDERVAMLGPAEPVGFARAMVRLASDAELRRRLATAARAFIEANHTWPQHVERVHALYAALEPREAGAASAARSGRLVPR
jgi:glycosyltransferase involved in cell wall biosynthesis